MHDSQYNVEDQERMSAARNYFAWQGELVRKEIGRRVIEVGCGIGNFTPMLLDREAVLAIDADAACVERLRDRYAGQPNLTTAVCELASSDLLTLKQFKADTCVCLNVLEHIDDDHQALDRMAAVLSPGGVIVIMVPALPALYGPIDSKLGHCRRYTRASLSAVAYEAGLQVRKIRFMNSVGMCGWWVNAKVLKREKQSAVQIRVFDRLIVPVLRPLEDVFEPPIGQSLFAVLQKP